MASDDDMLALELEAGICTYGERFHSSASDEHTDVAVKLLPRATEHDSERFITATLSLRLPPSYPEALPAMELADVKGLSEEQVAECLACLQHESESLRGEMMLGHLCEVAIDWVTDANHPSGDCVFCLQPVALPAAGPPSPAYSVLKLDCYHCFHMPCFGPWWHWQQRQLAQREQQLTAEYKGMAPGKLREEGIERDDEGVYTVRCPSCRAPVPPASLRHAWPTLQGSTADSWAQQAQQGPALDLDSGTARKLHQLQRSWRQALERQQRVGGLIDSERGPAVSLAELQLAADTGRQAVAAAAAAGSAAVNPRASGAKGAASGAGCTSADGAKAAAAGAAARAAAAAAVAVSAKTHGARPAAGGGVQGQGGEGGRHGARGNRQHHGEPRRHVPHPMQPAAAQARPKAQPPASSAGGSGNQGRGGYGTGRGGGGRHASPRPRSSGTGSTGDAPAGPGPSSSSIGTNGAAHSPQQGPQHAGGPGDHASRAGGPRGRGVRLPGSGQHEKGGGRAPGQRGQGRMPLHQPRG